MMLMSMIMMMRVSIMLRWPLNYKAEEIENKDLI